MKQIFLEGEGLTLKNAAIWLAEKYENNKSVPNISIWF